VDSELFSWGTVVLVSKKKLTKVSERYAFLHSNQLLRKGSDFCRSTRKAYQKQRNEKEGARRKISKGREIKGEKEKKTKCKNTKGSIKNKEQKIKSIYPLSRTLSC
jgi:ABC-type transporter lipoprotein component MlaA